MSQKTWEQHSCDVCILLDDDHVPKKSYYCDTCQAWICTADEFRLDRRMRAMRKRGKAPSPGCGGCGSSQPARTEVQPYDPVQKKMVGEMTFAERLAYDLRIKTEAVMKWNVPLGQKRQQIQRYEQEYQKALQDAGVQGGRV